MDDPNDKHSLVVRPVENQVAADRDRTKTGPKVFDRTSKAWVGGYLRDRRLETLDLPIRCRSVVARNLHPDPEQLEFRQVSASGFSRLTLPRDAWRAVRGPRA